MVNSKRANKLKEKALQFLEDTSWYYDNNYQQSN